MTKFDDNTDIKQSLADRLRQLKTNQESWKNRIGKNELDNCLFKKRFSIDDEIFKKRNQEETINKNGQSKVQTKLSDRMLSLEKSAKQWRNRVADKDNKKFTISGKMQSIDYTTNQNNTKMDRLKLDNSKNELNKDNFKKDKSAKKEIKSEITTIKSNLTIKNDLNLKNNLKSIQTTTQSTAVKDQLKTIELPRLDDNFGQFFKPIKLEKIVSPDKEDDDFFNELNQLESNGLTIIKKNVKIKNRKSPSSGNPLKKIQNTSSDFIIHNSFSTDLNCNSNKDADLKANSTNNDLIKKANQPKISSTIRQDLDPTAKAGLESKEDYRLVANKLKKKSIDNQEHLDSNNLLSNKKINKCLILVKGRKRIQVRLVEPNCESINEGDSYILITSSLVFVWIGRFSNIIERTRAIEIGNKIYKRKELGFLGGKLILIDNDKKTNLNDINTFKNLLKENTASNSIQFSTTGNEVEDEIYEQEMIKTNKVYILDQDKFRLSEQMCCKQLYQQQLNPYDAFVFDFNTEVYLWLGMHLSNECRSRAIELAQELYSQTPRLNCAIFYKCNQNMELILLQEKFFDWIQNYKLKAKSNSNDDDKRMNLKAFDVEEMIKEPERLDFILDNTNIGRGDFFKNENELLFIEIVTDDIKCWHINEFEKKEIKNANLGQFYDTETYVVRWTYRINRLGSLDNKKFAGRFNGKDKLNNGKTSNCKTADDKEENIFKKADRVNFRKHKETLDNNVTGRERYCYFYWSGLNCTINKSGASALMAIELDKEKSTQIQIKQTEEPPCFLRLFKGKFIIYSNMHHHDQESKDFDQSQPNRLFLVKGVYEEEAFLYEVKCEVSSLRSKGCFVLVNFKSRNVYLWIGKNASTEQIKIANFVCQNINKHGFSLLNKNNSSFISSSALKFNYQTVKHSFEISEFLNHFTVAPSLSLNLQIKKAIRNLANYDVDSELIIYHLSSLSGEFTFKQLICTYSSTTDCIINNFPFEQRRLYSVSQPAFFLIDNGQIVYLWQGHFPNNDDNILTGSINVRYSQEKKCALETVLSYCNGKFYFV